MPELAFGSNTYMLSHYGVVSDIAMMLIQFKRRDEHFAGKKSSCSNGGSFFFFLFSFEIFSLHH